MQGSIVVIGPSGSGKSTIGPLVARLLDWSFVDLDGLRDAWYPEFGIDRDAERTAWDRGGLTELMAYWKPFEALSVERVMLEYPTQTVIAFGGGQSVYDDEVLLAKVKAALAVASRVVLLLPDDDQSRALDIIRDRFRADTSIQMEGDFETFLNDFTPVITQQLTSESNRRLATDVIITGAQAPDQIASSIARLHQPLL